VSRKWAVWTALAALVILSQTPQSQGVAQPSPAPTTHAANRTDSNESRITNASEEAVPIRIIEEPIPSQSEQEAEADRREHDAEDLKAQERAAAATENQISPAWAAAIFAFVGTLLIFFTFMETRRVSRAELRAYVCVESISVTPGTARGTPAEFRKKIACHIVIKNSGQTPAYEVRHWAAIDFLPPSEEEKLEVPPLERVHMSTMPPGGVNTSNRFLLKSLTPEDGKALKKNEMALFIWGRVEYLDAFGRPRFTNYKVVGKGRWPLPQNGTPLFCLSGNDSN